MPSGVFEWHLLRGLSSTPSTPTHTFVRWYPSNPGRVKLNFDGSSNQYLLAGGFILRDWTGKVIKLGTTNYGHASSLVAEARALKDGLRMAIQAGYSRICVE